MSESSVDSVVCYVHRVLRRVAIALCFFHLRTFVAHRTLFHLHIMYIQA